MSSPLIILCLYLGVISLISVVVCCYDKLVSKTRRVSLRTSERSLLVLSLLGGSAAMLLCMLVIRHKTKHIKFMLGIPVILIAQTLLIFTLLYAGVIPLS